MQDMHFMPEIKESAYTLWEEITHDSSLWLFNISIAFSALLLQTA